MSIYNLDFDLLIKEYLPPDKRKPVEISWLNALLAPLQTLHNDTFLVYRPYIIGQAKQNGQRIIMESILNDVFNVTGPQFIYIDNSGNNILPDIFFNESEGLTPFVFYNESEGQPPAIFNNESEVTNNRRFVVFVPLAIYNLYGPSNISAEVDRLRPYSTFYTIQSY